MPHHQPPSQASKQKHIRALISAVVAVGETAPTVGETAPTATTLASVFDEDEEAGEEAGEEKGGGEGGEGLPHSFPLLFPSSRRLSTL